MSIVDESVEARRARLSREIEDDFEVAMKLRFRGRKPIYTEREAKDIVRELRKCINRKAGLAELEPHIEARFVAGRLSLEVSWPKGKP